MTFGRAHTRVAMLAGVVFLIFVATASYSARQDTDTVATLTPAWQLASHGNLTLDKFKGFDPWFVEARGRIVSNRLPGAIFFGVPFYWLLGRGDNWPPFFPAAIASAAAAATAVAIVYVTLRRLVADRVALMGSLLLAFGTATWTVSADALWTHGPNQMWIAAAILLAACGMPLASGFAFGAGIFTRPYTAALAAVFGFCEALQRRSWRWLLKIGAGSSVGLLALLAYNHHVFGGGATSALQGGYDNYVTRPSGTGLHAFSVNIVGALVSPERGIFVLSPALLLLLPGLRRAWAVSPSWVRSAAAGGLVYMLAQMQRNSFSGQSGFFSYRLAIEWLTASTPLLTLAYTEWTARTARRRLVFAGLAVVSVGFHAVGAITPSKFGLTDPWRNFDVAYAFQHHLGRAVAAVAVVALAAFVCRRTLRPSADQEPAYVADDHVPTPFPADPGQTYGA